MSRSIRFGDFVLNGPRGRLEDATGAERFLRPKSYRVLELLAERAGQLVSKDDLVAEAWPDVIVSDDSLAQCVSDIRRALGPDGAALLRTVPRRGYMLLEAETFATTPARVCRRRSSARSVTLAASLVATAGIWWSLPQDATRVPPSAVDPTLARAEALLAPRDWRRRADNERARSMLETLLADDPGNADAWASLGLTYWLEVKHLAWGGGRREMSRALEMVGRSIAIGGGARAHRLLAEMRLLAPFPETRSPVDALANARAAVAIAPDDPDNLAALAEALALTGRAGEAVRMIERARRLDPDPSGWRLQVAGLSYLLAGEAAKAAEEFGPLYGAGTFASARSWPGWFLAASLAHAGRIDEASAIVRAADGRRPERDVAGVAQSLDGFDDGHGLAVVLDGLRLAGMPG